METNRINRISKFIRDCTAGARRAFPLFICAALAWAAFVSAAAGAEFLLRKWDKKPETLDAQIKALKKIESSEARLEAAARWFLDVPYELDPMGEGDADTEGEKKPQYRLDAADCQTLVELALGFVYGADAEEAKKITMRLRYGDDPVLYKNRRHLTFGQWIENARKLNALKAATAETGGDKTKKLVKNFDAKKNCTGRWKTFCEKIGDKFPSGRFEYDYIPVADALAQCDKIPAGRVIMFINTERPWLPYQVSHMGVTGKKNGRATIIHASKIPGKTTEWGLCNYLKSQIESRAEWPLLGAALYAPM